MMSSPYYKNNFKHYSFEKVFDEKSKQDSVFEETGKALCDAFLEGKNCNMLVYGPTSTGKTFTMQGDVHNKSADAIIKYLFEQYMETTVIEREENSS